MFTNQILVNNSMDKRAMNDSYILNRHHSYIEFNNQDLSSSSINNPNNSGDDLRLAPIFTRQSNIKLPSINEILGNLGNVERRYSDEKNTFNRYPSYILAPTKPNNINRSLLAPLTSPQSANEPVFNCKPYFISLHNTAFQKRPRRKYNEVKRLYNCQHQGCNKSYGALNHLNAHIVSQGHGERRRASEFKI